MPSFVASTQEPPNPVVTVATPQPAESPPAPPLAKLDQPMAQGPQPPAAPGPQATAPVPIEPVAIGSASPAPPAALSPPDPAVPLSGSAVPARDDGIAQFAPPPVRIAATAAPPEPTASAAAAPSPALQLSTHVASWSTTAEHTRQLVLRLDPGELGQVQLTVHQPKDGPATVAMVVERPETLLLLLRDQPQLNHALNQAGIPEAGRQLSIDLAPAAAPSAAPPSSDPTTAPASQAATTPTAPPTPAPAPTHGADHPAGFNGYDRGGHQSGPQFTREDGQRRSAGGAPLDPPSATSLTSIQPPTAGVDITA